MKVEEFFDIIGADFYAGVPDSLLRPLCDFLMKRFGVDPTHHVIAANEGNAVAMAAGYHLATGKIPAVYLQNSGEGNIINPVASLMNDRVYAIPCIFVVGWRGEPGVPDEPQHVYQGQVTVKLLEDMGVSTYVVSKETTPKQLQDTLQASGGVLAEGKQIAFVVKKGALECDADMVYQNSYTMKREEILEKLVQAAGEDLIVSTTGKTSRELFEIRERNKQGHGRDFLMVGSMGHASSIALEIALQKPDRRIWCIDGDGAALMHLGAMTLIGANKPKNMIHVVINNGAHESVGGLPTVADEVDLVTIATGCGYPSAMRAETPKELDAAIEHIKTERELSFLELKSAIGSRADLGRPTLSAGENKTAFMQEISKRPID